jgi:type IV pilus assembly protein PilP
VVTEAPKAEPEYVYNPAGKADPFKPFIQLTMARRPGGVPLTPLQRYEVSQLKLVAIIASPGGNVALVEDSAGKGFFLKKGTLVGNNDGKVSRVLKDRVIIEEAYQDIYGKAKNAEVTLYLYRPEEEGTEQ